MADVKSSQVLAGPVDVGDPLLNIVPDTAGPLKPGKYVVTLVVTDDIGQKSQTANFQLEVRDLPGVKIDGPAIVALNQPIPLVARLSGTSGPIKTFTWTVKLG